MKTSTNLVTIAGIFALFFSVQASAKIDGWLPHDEAHPTQFSRGDFEVGLKKKKYKGYLKDNSKKDLVDLLEKKKKIPEMVISPDGEYYIIDGHHTSTALVGLGFTDIPYVVEHDFRKDDITMEEFWLEMIKRKWVYLRLHGKKLNPEDLPETLEDLQDDPFRSLAWFIRLSGGFNNLTIPFQEFAWADFFREHMGDIKLVTAKDYRQASKKALGLIHRAKPEKLDGYYKLTKKKQNKCRKALKKIF